MAVWNWPLGFSQAWEILFKSLVQTRTQNSQFSVCSGNFFLLDKFQSLTQGYHLELTRSSRSSAPLFRLVSDVQWTQSCYWVDKLLAPYTHLHNAYLSILMRKNYHRPIGAFWSTTNTTSPTFRLSVASLHFIWVLRVARNSSLQCLQNSFTRWRISIERLLGSNANLLRF